MAHGQNDESFHRLTQRWRNSGFVLSFIFNIKANSIFYFFELFLWPFFLNYSHALNTTFVITCRRPEEQRKVHYFTVKVTSRLILCERLNVSFSLKPERIHL